MKYFKYVVLFLASFALAQSAFATVGGPTTVGDFRYNPSNESVYYTEYNANGRGCPPMLYRMSLNSEVSEEIFSCDQGEEMLAGQATYSFKPVTNFINDFVGDFKKLREIDLKDNGFEIDINFVRNEYYTPEPSDDFKKSHFEATVYQNRRLVKSFNITGCNLDQPFLFSGYSIPGFNKRIMLLSSAKNDCFEGGYIGEKLYTFGQLDDISREGSVYDYKNHGALSLNERSLVVYEEDEVTVSIAEPAPAEFNETAESVEPTQPSEDVEGVEVDSTSSSAAQTPAYVEHESDSDDTILIISLLLVLLSVVGIILVFRKSR